MNASDFFAIEERQREEDMPIFQHHIPRLDPEAARAEAESHRPSRPPQKQVVEAMPIGAEMRIVDVANASGRTRGSVNAEMRRLAGIVYENTGRGIWKRTGD